MKRVFAVAILVLGGVSAAQAQEASPAAAGSQPATTNSYTAPSALYGISGTVSRNAGDLMGAEAAPGTGALAETVATAVDADPVPAAPANPAPLPDPKFLYGGRDDYRWQLGLGISWERFRSSIFNASAVGLNTSIAYYTNNWLGVEGNVMTGFAPTIFDREHVKLINFTGGPKIAWRQRRWEPWVHGLIGIAHAQPQTAGNSKNAFAVQAGGGADFRFNPRLSFRLQGDWLRTRFFGESQNNFTLVGGVVIHF